MKNLKRNRTINSGDKLTCKSNSWNGDIVAKDYRVAVDSVMGGRANSEYPWTEGRHALW